MTTENTPKKQNRGFRAMPAAKQRAIASKGGKASHLAGTGHEFTSAEAREAGRKGGLAMQARKKGTAPTSTGTTGDSK